MDLLQLLAVQGLSRVFSNTTVQKHQMCMIITNLVERDSGASGNCITLLTKVCVVKAMVFPVVMYGCESWTIKKAEHQRIDGFE